MVNVIHADEAKKAHLEAPKGQAPQQPDIYNVLFIIILEAMTIRQQTVWIESKGISSNASAQQQDNNLDRQLQFEQIPNGANTTLIRKIQNSNEAIANQRENVQNDLIILRQQAQVAMTVTNSNVNNLEQDASADSGWLMTLQQIMTIINKISQPPGS